MGWNKQVGDAWVLQRTAHFEKGKHDKALQLQLLSPLLDIADAHKLALAILEEVFAAAQSEGKTSLFLRETLEAKEQMFGSAVLKRWDEIFGQEYELQPWQRKIVEQMRPTIPVNEAMGRLRCRKCGGVVMHGQYRFGSNESGWEHMEGECIVVDGRIDYAPQFDEDDGCPND